MVGTLTFSTFVMAILGCTLYLFFAPLPEGKFWGTAGLLGITVFVTVVFSTDSFAVPNLWVVFGLITAASRFAVPVAETNLAAITGEALSTSKG